MTRKSLIAIVGATASGKSSLAMNLAKKLDGEIVSMDSMQIYKYLDIGTAKATNEDRELIPHHMLDILYPNEEYSVKQYALQARACIEDIFSKNKTPILVGGTGLYYQSIVNPMDFGYVKKDPKLREELEKKANTEKGREELYRYLKSKDSIAAEKIHPNDTKRLIRAIEVIKTSDRQFSKQKGLWETKQSYAMVSLAIDMEREKLYKIINARVDEMLELGLEKEVRGLLKSGVQPEAQSMQAIGYKQMIKHILGDCTLEEAIVKIKQGTRNYAKRQLTWFKRYKDISWISYSDDILAKALNKIKNFNKR